MTHHDQTQPGAALLTGARPRSGPAAPALAELEERYQRARARLLAASDEKAAAVEEFLAVSGALRGVPGALPGEKE